MKTKKLFALALLIVLALPKVFSQVAESKFLFATYMGWSDDEGGTLLWFHVDGGNSFSFVGADIKEDSISLFDQKNYMGNAKQDSTTLIGKKYFVYYYTKEYQQTIEGKSYDVKEDRISKLQMNLSHTKSTNPADFYGTYSFVLIEGDTNYITIYNKSGTIQGDEGTRGDDRSGKWIVTKNPLKDIVIKGGNISFVDSQTGNTWEGYFYGNDLIITTFKAGDPVYKASHTTTTKYKKQ